MTRKYYFFRISLIISLLLTSTSILNHHLRYTDPFMRYDTGPSWASAYSFHDLTGEEGKADSHKHVIGH